MGGRILAVAGIMSVFGLGPVAAQGDPATTTIDLRAGQLLSLVTSTSLAGTDSLRSEYFRTVIPMAGEYGLQLRGSLAIESVQARGPSPFPVMNLFTWTSAAGRSAFDDDPRFGPWKARRVEIWEELRDVMIEVPEDISLTFHEDRVYRVAALWLNRDAPQDFARYRDALAQTVEGLGGRYLVRAPGAGYESMMDSATTPDWVWIIEWPSTEAHQTYQSSDEFDRNHHLFLSGVERFDVYDTRFASGGARD